MTSSCDVAALPAGVPRALTYYRSGQHAGLAWAKPLLLAGSLVRMHSPQAEVEQSTAHITWEQILGQLMLELDDVAEDFLEMFRERDLYPDSQVSRQDVMETAKQTFDLLVRRLRGEPDPPAAAGLIERLAARRAQQGVPLSTFLSAVRIDFRVLWLRVQRIAGEDGSVVLAANVMRLLDTIEDYVDSLREAYRAEAARIDRTYAAQRHRMILRLFSGEPITSSEMDLIASRLNMAADARYEVVAVTGDATQPMIARFETDSSVGVFETVSALVLFREQTVAERWRRDAPVVGGYVGNVAGLSAVPEAAKVALHIARHAPASPPLLATEQEVWATVAYRHIVEVFPRHAHAISESLALVAEADRARLVQIVRTYLRTGSVKTTAEELFCHRNTVINRLRAFSDATGYDPTLPLDAAWISVALTAFSD